MSNIMILGGQGFAGAPLARKLLERGHKVTIFDITGPFDAWRLSDIMDDIAYQWKAIQDIESSDLKGQDTVVHLAAAPHVPLGITSPKYNCYQNVYGAVCLLEACRQVELDRVLYAGSGNEWGRPIFLPISEDHPLTPHNGYAFSKAAAELAFWTWWRCYNVPVAVMSNGCVIGPQPRMDIFVHQWLFNIAKGKPIRLEGGEQSRDLTYVSDVLDAWVLAIEAPRELIIGEKFQVSYGEEHTVKEILEMCFEVTGKRVPVIQAPYRPGEEGQRELFTNAKARRILGYNPQVPPKRAIELTWEWMQAEVLGRKHIAPKGA